MIIDSGLLFGSPCSYDCGRATTYSIWTSDVVLETKVLVSRRLEDKK